jgi:predicted DNA-binding protein (MmcQ/YjbR family)
MDAAIVRQLVARLEGAQEGAHHGHADFRVRNKIFATLNETEDRAAFRLTAIEGRALAADHPERFRLVSDREPIAWVSVGLETLGAEELEDLLEEAYGLRASETESQRRARRPRARTRR